MGLRVIQFLGLIGLSSSDKPIFLSEGIYNLLEKLNNLNMFIVFVFEK
jgi:hypothetical protein